MSPFNQNNKSFHMPKVLGFVTIAIFGVLIIGGIVMYLWNAILPAIAHFETISYWQAVGLLVLCRILFGNIGGRYKSNGRKPPFFRNSKNWMSLSEHERSQFKEEWKKRCQD